MEDQPAAGQLASNGPFVSSPVKHSNPLASQSNWSFGWQNNTKTEGSRPTSGGTPSYIQASSPTIIRAASCSETPRRTSGSRSPNPTTPRNATIPSPKNPSGTTTPRMQGRPPWSLATKNPTTGKRMISTRCAPPPPSPGPAANDQLPSHQKYPLTIY
jgi:hypothetical protein